MKSKIIVTPDPRLRQKSAKVQEITPEIQEIIAKMIRASVEWEKEHEFELSAALAAPQMGFSKRIIVVREDMGNKANASFIALINPEIIKNEGKVVKDYEGCLSVPKVYGLVPRYGKTRLKAMLEDGTEVRLKATDFLARTLQHEIDHLDGVLFIDHIKDEKNAFFELDGKGDLRPLDYDKHIKNNKTLFPDE
ncbi:MAG: peptide deformylase [Candidatus Nomurabacteria bacterium]|jgi:peptide deformylase|nr:peptide deformylase [Candidatus Nomurabacteria bacterium]